MEEQEKIARHFYAKLQERFGNLNNGIQITIQGAGVHWSCEVTFQNRFCNIWCFKHVSAIPQYAIGFEENGKEQTKGRTFEVITAIDSIQDWFQP